MTKAFDDAILELRKTFLSEAEEEVENLESLLISLEEAPEDRGIIDSIMRVAHTLKGSSAAVDFTMFADFAHEVENLLVAIQKKAVQLDENIVDILLKSNDRFKLFVEELKRNPDAMLDSGELQSQITSVLSDTSSKTSAKGVIKEKIEQLEQSGFGFFDDIPDEGENQKTDAVKRVSDSPDSKKDKDKSEHIRVSLDKIDNLLNSFGEQVILQALLEDASTDVVNNENLIAKTVMQLGKITYDLQHTTMSLRMINLKGIFQKIKRTARDTAGSLGKKVKVTTIGEETELDKILVDQLNGVITHIIRNAVDHGIEDPERRKQDGKAEEGRLTVRAYQEQGSFYLEIEDDGKGLDDQAILKKSIQMGLVGKDAELSSHEIYQLILRSGFSTKEKVTDISGRGVGMDAVHEAISNMRGTLVLDSEKGKGSKFTIRLPLSMSIFNGIIFKIMDNKYVLPSSEIKEIYRFKNDQARRIDKGKNLLEKGTESMTLVDFGQILGRRSPTIPRESNRRVALIVNRGGRNIALEVDEIVGNRRIVQKSLGDEFKERDEFSGGAILSDGQVALVLNLSNLNNLNTQAIN